MKLQHLIYSKKFTAIVAVVILASVGVFGVFAKQGFTTKKPPIATNLIPALTNSKGQVHTQVQLSQTKVVQGTDGEIYLKLTLEPDGSLSAGAAERKPTDFVVVLDRSGSMAEKNKMTYAHRAIESLIAQMKAEDKLTLVTFDGQVETPILEMAATSNSKSLMISRLKAVQPRGGTDLASGLLSGVRQLKKLKAVDGRAKRLILISDGHANQGITNPHEIGQLAKKEASGEFAVSTLGVGLHYNEQLLANIADHGMGNYHFLERLGDMDKILAQEFTGASQVVVQNLRVQIHTPGVKLVDASGYPVEKIAKGGYVFTPGHLYAGQKKVVYLTMQVPTTDLKSYPLGQAQLTYSIEGKDYALDLMNNDFEVACLPQEKKEEAVASIDKEVFKDAWEKNNYGRFLKNNASSVRTGKTTAAKKAIKKYKAKLEEVLQVVSSPALQAQYGDMDSMESEVDSAEGNADQQKLLGKKYHSGGMKSQRK